MPDARGKLLEWRADPALFAWEALGVRAWSRQRDIFNAVATHTRVVTRSGHKVSKTCTIACLALWKVCCWPRARVVLSSAVGDQLRNILWPELTRIHKHARAPIGGDLAIDYKGGLWFDDDRAVIALKSEDTKPEAFAGISSPHLLYLIDEASGFPDALLEAAWGNCASNGTIAAFSNPTRTAGWFYDAFGARRNVWHTIHIDSRESPNITGAEPHVPGLAEPQWLVDTIAAFGANSSTVSVRVAGQFPRTGDCTVNGLELVEAAQAREVPDEGELRFGLDVGRTGDDPSVLSMVRGKRAWRFEEKRGAEGDVVAGWVLSLVREVRRDGDERPVVRVDVIGVGASVYDHLKREREVIAVAVNVSNTANDERAYQRKRDELWFAGQSFLRDGAIPRDDGELHGELVAARYSFDARGRYVVESKDDMKKRLKRSPNKADAFNLAVSSDPVAELSDDMADDFAKLLTRAE